MPFTDWDLGAPAGQAPMEYSFVMSTTVDDLSYTPSEEEKSRDAAQFVATGRKSWKTLKGKGEAVWPPLLEAALLEALEKYSPDTGNTKSDKIMGRFPMRNRFISDYIFETTGKRRTPKQVGSRLQQLRDTCKKEQILQLISHRHTPELSSADSQTDSSHGASPSPQPENDHQHSTNLVYVKIALQNELWPAPTPCIHLIRNDQSHPQTIQLSPLSYRPNGLTYHEQSATPNMLPFLCNIVEFRSQYALAPESMIMVYTSGSILVHIERVMLECVSSPVQKSGWTYRSGLASDFWGALGASQDLSDFLIVQNLKAASAGVTSSSHGVSRSTPVQGISVMYRFNTRSNVSRHSPLANAPVYPTLASQTYSTHITSHSNSSIVSPSSWQIGDACDNLGNEALQPLASRYRQSDSNLDYPTAMNMATSYGYQRSCSGAELSYKDVQANSDPSIIHAPVPMQYPHQVHFYS